VPFPAAIALLATLAIVAVQAARALGLADLRSLFQACSGRVLGVALHLLHDRDEAEDVLQETFLEIWRRPERYDPARGTLEAWVVLIARSRALDRLRARGSALRLVERAADDPIPEPPAPFELLEGEERGSRVARALSTLPAPQRQAIELAFFAGLTQAQIAGRLGEPLGTVKTRIRLGMEKLAGELAEDAA
jgi:RNA polymerase sigma-70 factor (ECF subfamily)